MAKLTPTARSKLSRSTFAVPSKAPGPGSYPIPDANHAKVAIGLASMHHSSKLPQIRAAAKRKFGIG
ncbi:MAG TPA: hypothetical protein VLH80_07605 [Nitrospiraceae bacterium]|nr:hypothetical protein [Nitrospiraceae bacterium]